jgi:hypothetical protein
VIKVLENLTGREKNLIGADSTSINISKITEYETPLYYKSIQRTNFNKNYQIYILTIK